MTVRRPPCCRCPLLSSAWRVGQEAAGPKAESPRGGCPLPHPAACSSPRWPRTLHAPPDPAHVAGNGTPQDLFSGPVRPPRAPCSPEAQMPRPCPREGQATPPGGWGRCGRTKGSLWSRLEPAAWHAHTGRGLGSAVLVLGPGGRGGCVGGPPALRLRQDPQAWSGKVTWASGPCTPLLGPHFVEMKGNLAESVVCGDTKGGGWSRCTGCVPPIGAQWPCDLGHLCKLVTQFGPGVACLGLEKELQG